LHAPLLQRKSQPGTTSLPLLYPQIYLDYSGQYI